MGKTEPRSEPYRAACSPKHSDRLGADERGLGEESELPGGGRAGGEEVFLSHVLWLVVEVGGGEAESATLHGRIISFVRWGRRRGGTDPCCLAGRRARPLRPETRQG